MRQRRQRIAGEARDAHHAVVLLEERRQRVVVDRPVVGDAVERLHLEVGRMQPRPMRRVHDGRAADGVEVHDLDRRVVVVDRIVLRAPADVRAGRPLAVELRFPVAPGARIFGLLHPAALVEAEDVHLGLGQRPCDRRAGSAGADDQDVYGFVHSCSLFHLHVIPGGKRRRNPEPRDSRCAIAICFASSRRPAMTISIHDPHRQRADAADEIRIKPLAPGRRSRSAGRACRISSQRIRNCCSARRSPTQRWMPAPKARCCRGLARSMMNSSARSILSSSRLPEMYHITTLSPLAILRPQSSVSRRAVRRMCSTGV